METRLPMRCTCSPGSGLSAVEIQTNLREDFIPSDCTYERLRHYIEWAPKHGKSTEGRCEIGTLVQDHNQGAFSVIVNSL